MVWVLGWFDHYLGEVSSVLCCENIFAQPGSLQAGACDHIWVMAWLSRFEYGEVFEVTVCIA